MSGTFKDHFSGVAAGYQAFRPGYPPALFDWLAGRGGASGQSTWAAAPARRRWRSRSTSRR